MIASFLRRFIFIKTRKTGGTSIEIALTPFCGSDDIVAPITPEDELLRLADGKVAARNFAGDRAVEEDYRRRVLARDPTVLVETPELKARGFYNHMPAAEIRERLPADFWNAAFKFTIERHPYERLVSTAYFRSRSDPGKVDAMIDQLSRELPDEVGRYSIDGKVVADEVLRYESLEDDFRRVATRLGLNIAFPLPRAKTGFRSDRRPAREILSREQRRRIYERQRRAFELLGYEP